jgi:hypothetical protein
MDILTHEVCNVGVTTFVYTTKGRVMTTFARTPSCATNVGHASMTPNEARDYAAELVAAADRAEKK